MQYIRENLTFPPDQSFTIRREIPEIKKCIALRSHVNYKIALIENCCGKRFIGDHIQDFKGTELVLLGSDLPHCWQYTNMPDPRIPPETIEIHFFPDFLGKDLLTKPEAKQLNRLLDGAAKGLIFTEPTITQAKTVMQQMLHERGLGRAALMLTLLHTLARSENVQALSAPGFHPIGNPGDTQKLNKVFKYIFANFKHDITLKEVAAVIPMSPSAFCRFFKTKTNRTLIDFVKEVRIAHAAKLLLEGKHNVTEACYDCGYNNISNFNKHFKEVKKTTPRNFVKQFEQGLQ